MGDPRGERAVLGRIEVGEGRGGGEAKRRDGKGEASDHLESPFLVNTASSIGSRRQDECMKHAGGYCAFPGAAVERANHLHGTDF